jgi:hypothetical protein
MHPAVRVILQSMENFLGTYLYNLGDEITALTGGWVKRSDSVGTYTKESTYLSISNTTLETGGAFYTTNSADVSSYNKIKATFSDVVVSGSAVAQIYMKTAANGGGTTLAIAQPTITSAAETTIELDVSALATGYVYVGAFLTASGSVSSKITKIWLE